jgi:hypothetical protein
VSVAGQGVVIAPVTGSHRVLLKTKQKIFCRR